MDTALAGKGEKMSDYIKRESRTFIEIADDLNDLVTELNDKIVESIREKNVGVAPVRHGHWIDDAGALRCSECGVSFPDLHPLYENAVYCPNCGARMGGDENE